MTTKEQRAKTEEFLNFYQGITMKPKLTDERKSNYAYFTHQGKIRTRNEDRFLASAKNNIYAALDGMGGEGNGDVYAEHAKDYLLQEIKKRGYIGNLERYDLMHTLKQDITTVKKRLRTLQERNPDLSPSGGTTLTCIRVLRERGLVAWGHVGDSRLYLIRPVVERSIENDRPMETHYVTIKQITKDQASGNSLDNVVGGHAHNDHLFYVDTGAIDVQKGDMFMLCTDGLTNMIGLPEIERAFIKHITPRSVIMRKYPLNKVAYDLGSAAYNAGGRDNITVVLVRI